MIEEYPIERDPLPPQGHGELPHDEVMGAAGRILGIEAPNVGSSPNAGPSNGNVSGQLQPSPNGGGQNPNNTGNTVAVMLPPGQTGEAQESAVSEVDATVEAANRDVIAAITDPDTQHYVFNAFVSNPDGQTSPVGQRSAPYSTHFAATIGTDGARLDLQHSTFLSEPVEDDTRARTRESIMVTLEDGSGNLKVVAYNNQTLAEVPSDWGSENSWLGIAQRDFEATGGQAATIPEHVAESLNMDFGKQKFAKREAAARESAGEVASAEGHKSWDYRSAELPTELVIGETFGGDTELAGMTVSAVTVGSRVLNAAGQTRRAGSSGVNYEQTTSPIVYTDAILQAVEQHNERVA